MAKTLLIGWDAADWQIINPLIEQGLMPTLARIKKEGVYGNLATLKPVLSPVLWTSIATGKRSYQHGIHGFVQIDPATAKIDPVRVSTRKCEAVWNMLSESGLKTNVVNWWPSYPAEKVNGVYVSNRFHIGAPAYGKAWPLGEHTIYPEEWQAKLESLRLHPAELTLAHIEPFIKSAAELDPEKDPVLKSLMRILAHTSSIHNACTELMAKTDWDFMAVYQESIDHFSHLAMKYHPPRLAEIPEESYAKYKDIVSAAYRFHDMMLARLLKLAGPNTNVLLISDHGFENGQQRTAVLPEVPAAPALEHRRFGVLLAHGPDFNKGEEIFGASLLDITPSLLHLHGLPVGEDMDGRVLQQLFRKTEAVGYIESWEGIRIQTQEVSVSTDKSQDDAVLRQLAEIGYIDLPEKEKQAYVQYELTYNLIQSLVDGHQWVEAEKQAQTLFQKFEDGRSAKILLHILHRRGDLSSFHKMLERFRSLLGAHHPDVLYFTALLKNMEGAHVEAIQYLQTLEKSGALSVQLYLQLTHSFFLANKTEPARDYAKKALAMDSENAAALSMLGEIEMLVSNHESAIEFFIASLSLQYYQPNVHYQLAKAYRTLGHLDKAEKALNICLVQAPKHQGALQLKKQAPMEKENPILIVSGLPRSGTSLMMQILHAGGVEVVADKHRVADEHNPQGYWEDERVKQLAQKADWLDEAKGKALKVVSPLLRFLPTKHTYYVISMDRPLMEVLLSQEKMKGRTQADVLKNFPFKLALDFETEQKRLLHWLEQQPNMRYISISFADCVQQPKTVIERLRAFLPHSIQSEKALKAINKNLYRNKLA